MGKGRIATVLLAAATGLIGLASPALAAPCGNGGEELALEDSAGWTWDLNPSGSVDNGIGDAFDGFPNVFVGGVFYPNAIGDVCTHEDGGREIQYPEVTLSGLEVTRKVFVPANGTPFARFQTLLRNGSGAPVTTTYLFGGASLGSDGDTVIRLTSSGDTTATVGDAWAVSDDSGGGARTDPTLLQVWDGTTPGAPQTVSSVNWATGDGSPEFNWNVTVPPGATYVFMHVIGQRSGLVTAAPDAPALAAGAPDVFVGMSAAELGLLRNWVVPVCRGKTATVFGTSSNDVLSGTGDDAVLAGVGNDTVATGSGTDRVCAGDGNDKVNGGGGKDFILGQGGNDRMNGGPGTDTCKGGPGKDKAKACEKGKA